VAKTDGQSEPVIVPLKVGNAPRRTHWREGPAGSGQTLLGDTADAGHSMMDVYTRQQRLAEHARAHPQRSFTTLAHHLDEAWLEQAWRRVRKDGAVGVDGVTAQMYEADLSANLARLLDRAKSGRYRAPPVRRVYVPKGDGRGRRPLGIPTLEDKILQRAVAMLLEPIYERDFHDASYGFRPGRSAHDALEQTWRGLMDQGGGWVLDVDIQDFFGTLDHEQLRAMLAQRVSDGVIRRLIGKWLKAGILEEGQRHRPVSGTPQGGVISPLLANLYLHEVFDMWFEREVRPRLTGRAWFTRYADDLVLVFANRTDAQRTWRVLEQRLERFGLRLHPDKTRLVRFTRPGGDRQRPQTFDLLGFTHYWGRSRRGRAVIKRRTAKDRFRRAARRLNEVCRAMRHWSLTDQHARLERMLRGHDAYYGITGNMVALKRLHHQAERIWIYWLRRRSQRSRLRWDDGARRLLSLFALPSPRIVHQPRRA